jgi:hypothetical protein
MGTAGGHVPAHGNIGGIMKRWVAVIALMAVAGLTAFAEETKKDEVELQGQLGCAHCSYHKGQSCGVGFKTADGKIYVFEDPAKELMDARTKGGQIKVKGTVTEKDGVLLIAASKAELVK